MATDPTDIQIDPARRQKVNELAERNGTSASSIVAEALDEYLNGHLPPRTEDGETLYDIATRRGAIGMIKGGPSDMSTNPKYMEGFGEDA